MTPAREAVLAFVRQRISEGCSPTLREIAKHFGWSSTNAPRQHLWALVDAGYLVHAGERVHRPWRLAERGVSK